MERTLAALSAGGDGGGGNGRIPRDTLELVIGDLPADLLAELRSPSIRPDRLAEAQDRLAAELSDDELAQRIVGRLVCDRLR